MSTHREETYGYFPGGGMDPRLFTPDREVCTPDEIAAWKAACEAWNRGERPLRFEVSGNGASFGRPGTIACGSAYGMGTWEIDMPDDEPEPGAVEDIPALVAS